MNAPAKTPFEAGYVAGISDDVPMDDFEMSMRHNDFVIGYIVGHSESESFRAASSSVAAWTAGELAFRYNVPLKTLIPRLGFDTELRAELRQAYRDAAESAAQDDESTEFGS